MNTELVGRIQQLIESAMSSNEGSPYVLSWRLAKEIAEITRTKKYTVATDNLNTRER